MSFDTSLLNVYLIAVFALAAVALISSISVVAVEVAHNRRERLSKHESMRTYYGRLALHH